MKTKILVIEPYCPTPSDSGGKTRINHTLRFLSQYFSIELLTFYHNHTEIAVNKTFFEKLNIHPTFFPACKRELLSFVTKGVPYWFGSWYSTKLVDRLKKVNFSEYSSVLIEQTQLLYLIDYIPKNIPTVFSAHDISTISFWRRLSDVGMLKKLIHFPRFLEVYFYELCYLRKFTHVVAVSKRDAYILKLVFHLQSVIIIENGVEKIDFITTKSNKDRITIGYIGSQSHTPNKKAIEFITTRIFPHIKSKNVSVNLAGSDSGANSQDGINLLGFVPSTKKFFEQIDILVTPIFAGSGSRVKILESLSFGCPVITTEIGGEGLNISSPLLTIIPKSQETVPSFWADKIMSQKRSYSKEVFSQLAFDLSKYLWSSQLSKYNSILKNK